MPPAGQVGASRERERSCTRHRKSGPHARSSSARRQGSSSPRSSRWWVSWSFSARCTGQITRKPGPRNRSASARPAAAGREYRFPPGSGTSPGGRSKTGTSPRAATRMASPHPECWSRWWRPRSSPAGRRSSRTRGGCCGLASPWWCSQSRPGRRLESWTTPSHGAAPQQPPPTHPQISSAIPAATSPPPPANESVPGWASIAFADQGDALAGLLFSYRQVAPRSGTARPWAPRPSTHVSRWPTAHSSPHPVRRVNTIPGCEADEQQGRVHLEAEGGQPGPVGERVRGSEQRHAASRRSPAQRMSEQLPDEADRVQKGSELASPAGPARNRPAYRGAPEKSNDSRPGLRHFRRGGTAAGPAGAVRSPSRWLNPAGARACRRADVCTVMSSARLAAIPTALSARSRA